MRGKEGAEGLGMFSSLSLPTPSLPAPLPLSLVTFSACFLTDPKFLSCFLSAGSVAAGQIAADKGRV